MKFNLLLITLFFAINTSYGVVMVEGEINAHSKAFSQADFEKFDEEKIMNLTPEKFEAENGRKMKFKEKLALKMLQKKIKKANKKKNKKAVAAGFSFHLGAFLLCLFLSLLGLLIAWLVWGSDRDVLISGAIGVAVSLVLWGGLLFGVLG